MVSDQWNGFHHAPRPDDEDDDWYYDDEPDYHHQLADRHLPPPPPPPPPAPQPHQSNSMLHYQSHAQPAPQPKVKVDLSRVSYSSWQNPWTSALRYQNQGVGHSAYGGYSAWDYQDEDYQDEDEEEDQDEEYASSGKDWAAGETDDSVHTNTYFHDQDGKVVDAPEPPPAVPGPSYTAVPPPPPPAPAPPQAAAGLAGDVVIVPPPPPLAPIQIVPGPLPLSITVPSSPSSGKSVHFPDGLEDPKGTSIQKGKKVLNRKASSSNLKEQSPPKPIIPLVQKREHKGPTWKEQQEKRRQDHEKRREVARQQALKWMEAAKKKKELDLQQKKEAAEKAKKKREEDAEKAKKKTEEEAIKAKKKAEEAKKKKELEDERAKKKAEEAKKRKDLEAKKKEEAKKKAEEVKKKLSTKKSALKKGKSTKDASKDGDTESTSGGGDAAAGESGDDAPPPAPDPPTATEKVTKSDSPNNDSFVREPSSAAVEVAEAIEAEVTPLSSKSSNNYACIDANPSANERVDAPAETTTTTTTSQVEKLVEDDAQYQQEEETQVQQSDDDCPVEPEDRVTSDPSLGGQDSQENASDGACGPESLGQGEGEQQGKLEPDSEPSGDDSLADQTLDKSSTNAEVEHNVGDDGLQVEPAAHMVDHEPLDVASGAPPQPPQPQDEEATAEQSAVPHVDIPDESQPNDGSTNPLPVGGEVSPASDEHSEAFLDDEIAVDYSESQLVRDGTTETKDTHHVDDERCSKFRGATSGNLVFSEVPIEDEISQDLPKHDDEDINVTNDVSASGEEGGQSNDHQDLSHSDTVDVGDILSTRGPPGDDPGTPNSAIDLADRHEESYGQSATDDISETTNGQPADPAILPDQILQEETMEEKISPNGNVLPDMSGGQDEDSLLQPQKAGDKPSDDDQSQIVESDQGEAETSVPPTAPDDSPIHDQTPLHETADSISLSQQETSDQPSLEALQPDENAESEFTPPTAPTAPASIDTKEPTEQGSPEAHNQPPTDEPEPIETSIPRVDGLTEGKSSANDQWIESQDANSVKKAASDAPNTDKQGQQGDQEALGATEQQPSPTNVDQVDPCRGSEESDSVLLAAPDVSSQEDESGQDEQQGNGTNVSPENIGSMQVDSQDENPEQADEHEKHERTNSSQETPEVTDSSNESKDRSSKDDYQMPSVNLTSDERPAEAGESHQEDLETASGPHDHEPQDERIQEGKSDPSAAPESEKTSSTRDTAQNVSDQPKNSVESTAEAPENTDCSQEPDDVHGGAEGLSEKSSTMGPLDKAGKVVGAGENGNGTNDPENIDPSAESSDTKPTADGEQNIEDTDGAQEDRPTEESKNAPPTEQTLTQDTGPQEPSGEVDSAQQTAGGEGEQPSAGEEITSSDGVENTIRDEPRKSEDVERATARVSSEPKEAPPGASSAENVATQQDDSKSSSTPEENEGNENKTTPESKDTSSLPDDHQDTSTRKEPDQKPESQEGQAVDSSVAPDSLQETQKSVQPDATDHHNGRQEEDTTEGEEPHYTESDYRIMEEIMNPPLPPPEPEPEAEPKSVPDQTEQIKQKDSVVAEDGKSDSAWQEADPDIDASSVSGTGTQVAEGSGEDVGQSNSEETAVKPDASPNGSERLVSDGSESKASEDIEPDGQESATVARTDDAIPTNEDDKLVEAHDCQTETHDSDLENSIEAVQASGLSSADDAVTSLQENSPVEAQSLEDGQALDDENQSDLSDEDDGSENEDDVSIASSTVAAVGEKDESQDEDESSDAGTQDVAKPSQALSSETHVGEDTAMTEPSTSQESPKLKPNDGVAGSSTNSEPPDEQGKMTLVDNDAAESEAQSPGSTADESSVKEPPDHGKKENSAVVDSSAGESKSVQVEPSESAVASEDHSSPEELFRGNENSGEGGSQPVAQKINEGPRTNDTAKETNEGSTSSDTVNETHDMASQESSNPPLEDTADSQTDFSPGHKQESESPAESDPKDSGSSEESGSADNVTTQDSAQNDSREENSEVRPEQVELNGSAQPLHSDSPLVKETNNPGASEDNKLARNDETTENSPAAVDAVPETQHDDVPGPSTAPEETHGDSSDPSVEDPPADGPPSDESKDDEQWAEDSGETAEDVLPKDNLPVAPPVESVGQVRVDEVIATEPDSLPVEQPRQTEETTAVPKETFEDVKILGESVDVMESIIPDGDATEPREDEVSPKAEDPSATEDPSLVIEEQSEPSALVASEPVSTSLPVEDIKVENEAAQVEKPSLETFVQPSAETEPEVPAEQHHSEAPAGESSSVESVSERIDDLPLSPSDPHKERKHRRRSSVSYHNDPYLRRHSTTSTDKGSYTISSSGRDQAPPLLRRGTVDKGFRRVSIPVDAPEEGEKYRDRGDRQRKKDRRRSHVSEDLDDDETRRRRRREIREREATEVEEATLRAEQTAAELKFRDLAQDEFERQERREAKKAAAKREKLRQLEEEARLQEKERLRKEAHERLEEENRRIRMEREAKKLQEAGELKRQKLEELEREEARKLRKRERRHRDRERRVPKAEGDSYPPAIPPRGRTPIPEVVREEAPKPRRRRTGDLNTTKPRAASPPPKRQSLMGGLFGLSRSTTEPVVTKTIEKGKSKARERPAEFPHRPSAIHRSSSHRKHHRTPSEERRHQERKAERRASKTATSSLNEAPALHDPIPQDAPVDAVPEEPSPAQAPSSPVQEAAEPTSPQGPKAEAQLPPRLPRATNFAEYGQTEREIDGEAAEPGSSHGGGSSEQRKHHYHHRRREHHDGDRERDREKRHHQHRRNSAALDNSVGGTSNKGKGRERAADHERDKGKHRSSRVPAEEDRRRDNVMESKHRSSGSGRTREKEKEREHERNKRKGKSTTNGSGGSGGGGFFESLKKLVK